MTKNNKAAVFILMGQSNAVGYATLMPEAERMAKPLKNVFGLTRKNNLSYDNKELIWTGYTSHETILGEENDHTYSISNCLARFWQDEIDSGHSLPDLYIVNISIGAQGITSDYMWNPHRKPKLVPGPLGTVDISLCPFAAHILSLIKSSFEKIGKNYEIIGLHWRGGENDITVPKPELEKVLKSLYLELFQTFYDSLGEIPPVILHKIICAERALDLDPSGAQLESMYCIDRIFQELEYEHQNIRIFDVRNAPHYTPHTRQYGIFLDDVVHYTPETNQWVSKKIMESYQNSIY